MSLELDQKQNRQRTASLMPAGGLLLSLLLAGCANHHRIGEPIVDLQGADPAVYSRDLAECRQFSGEVAVGTRVGAGAVAGAVLGGAIGAAVGDSRTAQQVAGAGAANGAARGGLQGMRTRSDVVKSCLRQRGYRVLN